MLTLGIDIGGTTVKAALVRDDATIATGQSDIYSRPDRATLELAVRHAVHAAMHTTNTAPDAIGLCAPGLFDESSRTITMSVNVPGLVGTNLDELVASATGQHHHAARAVTIVTDAHAAAFDAWCELQRELPRPGRFLGISLGTGIGACVLDDGRPLIVVGRSPGHFGQIDVSVLEPGVPVPIGPDQGRGSLEAYLGVPALRARFGPDFPAALARSSAAHAPLAALVRAIRIAHAMYRPQTIALLGGIGLALKPVLSDVHAAVNDHLTSLARPGWTLTVGRHAFHAAAGAARLATPELL